MNKYKEDFNNKKQEIIKLLNVTGDFYKKFNHEKEAKIFEDIIKNVEEEDFSIVLVGEFSAGKSTFLNALMGERVLPSFTNETTATINYLRHKSRAKNGEAGIVYFKDGSKKVLDEIDFELIKTYASTDSKLGVVKEVKYLELYLDCKFLEGNVTLVDSPGLNGTADHHRDVTEEQIGKSNASIFMFKANQPGSDTDFKFLEALKNRVKTIIFALNKIDEIKASEGETVESVISKLKENYQKRFPNEVEIPEILGISAYQALVARSEKHLEYRGKDEYSKDEKDVLEKSSRMTEFEDRLWKFMTQGEKAKAMIEGPICKVIDNLKDIRASIELERELLEDKHDSSEIEEEIIKVKEQIDGISSEMNTINSDLIRKVNVSISEIQENFENKADDLKTRTVDKLKNWEDIIELIDFENNLKVRLEKEYTKLIKKSELDLKSKVRYLIEENYEQIAGSINDEFDESKFNVQINSKLSESDFDVELGIEKYESAINELENKLAEKEKEGNEAKESLLKTRRIEREKNEIRDKIIRSKAEREKYEFMIEPRKEYNHENGYEEVSRGGVFGVITNVLVGKKRIPKMNSELVNSNEIEAFKKKKEDIIKEYDSELKNLHNTLKNMKSDDSEQAELRLQIKIREEEKLNIQLKKMEEEFKINYVKKNKRALEVRKGELENYFDELNDECIDILNRELSKNKNLYIGIIKIALSSSLEDKLKNKKRECELLEEKMNSSIDSKKTRLEELVQMEVESDELMKKAISIKVSI